MDQLIILQGISHEQFMNQIEALIQKSISPKIDTPKPLNVNKLMTRKEVAEYLYISLPTLNDWTKMGWLKSYQIGSRILYQSNEVDKSLNERKFKRF